jgi:hypothetical protein
MRMNLSRILYLTVFLAPVSFLMGYIAGAPRAQGVSYQMAPIDEKPLPVSPIDFYRQEDSLVVETPEWLKPNLNIERR